jgi:homoserine kinase
MPPPSASGVVEVTVPGTIANLGPGFDVLALAVQVHDRIRVSLSDREEVTFQGEGAEALAGVKNPMVARAARAVAERAGRPVAFRIEVESVVPVARGLGSSAAAIAGGLVAANRLLESPLDLPVLVEIGAALEGHPENVAAALLGGVVVVTQTEAGECAYKRFLPRLDFDIVLAVPRLALPTAQARAVLPSAVSLRDAVYNVGRAALLVTALLTGDEGVLADALDDRLHQPYRAQLVPGLMDVLAGAREAGAYGAVLAGSGSAVAALARAEHAATVGDAMREAFARHGLPVDIRVTQVDPHGAVVHEEPAHG